MTQRAWELEGRDALRPGAFDAELLRRLWVYVRPQRVRIFASLGLLLLTQALRLLQPMLIALAIDRYLVRSSAESSLGAMQRAFERWAGWCAENLPGRPSLLTVLIGTFAAAALIEFFARRRQIWLLDLAGQNALLDLRQALFRHLQRLSSSFYDRTPVGKLVGRVTTDIEALQEMFSSGVVTILGDFINLGAMAVILLLLQWKLALAAFAVVPLLLILTGYVRGRVRRAYEVLVSRRSAMSGFLHEQVSGMSLVQAFGRERRAADDYGRLNRDMRDSQLTSVRWESVFSASTELLGGLTTALILWFGGGLVIARLFPDAAAGSGAGAELGAALGGGLTIGVLFVFIDYMGKFFQPLSELSLKYTVMQNAMTASAKIFSLMDEASFIAEPAEPRVPDEAPGRVEFGDVRFSYSGKDADRVLHGVDFELRPAEHVAVVGATGSGKTTLFKLLVRLYERSSGAILLDGQDVRDYAVAELRARVGVVPQDVFLFEGTILDNLRLGNIGPDGEEVDEEHAIQAAEQLGLGEIVRRFPAGYRAIVQERGKNFSSGERQLIAFARALAAAPQVVVLDEATSNVDTRTEELLGRALDKLLDGRTALIIAHRLSTIRNCDRILVMGGGRLLEQGSHTELLARRGAYWELHRRQELESA